jgi:hypothetical protein
LEQAFVAGAVETPEGPVPRVSSILNWRDRLGTIKARWGVGRMDYTVDPGLYALGNPDRHSRVLVTANYKMSLDKLRAAIPGRDLWILVLDTKGINVWCAAGKGTFGTEELVRRIKSSGLERKVDHRDLILPQLSAPGVAAHEVKKRSGFRVRYGPIRADDLPAYLDGGLVATPRMRRKTFDFRERLALIPLELVSAMKPGVLILLAFFLLSGLGGSRSYWTNAADYGLWMTAALIAAMLAGAVLSPAFLPYLPGRAFSFKGFCLGTLTAVVLIIFREPNLSSWPGRLESLSWLLLVPSLASYLAMNFTGASTYTSLSGVMKEMRLALPLQIVAAVVGTVCFLIGRFIS